MADVATAPDAEALLRELAAKIRPHVDPSAAALVGIYTGGVWLAQRLKDELAITAPVGTLDISFYRDDFGTRGLNPNTKRSDIPFEVQDRHIVLVDDVLYTGRTIRAALNELFDYGRPASIRLAVLVDRDCRELPIAAQFVGTTFAVERDEILVLERDEHAKLNFKLQKKARADG
jgi:pyrimidine operon attenuation protein / uracil phosphoribosyltransferase